jgi:LysR family transcriptional regulator, nod-box dependent transcriptional activator
METILPSLLVRLQGDRYNVRALPVPFAMPVLQEWLYWHNRNVNDAGHLWMAKTLEQVVEDQILSRDD